MELLDRLAAEILAPLAVWVLASGLDDLYLDLTYFYQCCRSRLRYRTDFAPVRLARDSAPSRDTDNESPESAKTGRSRPATAAGEPLIALLVPCWQEADVIEDMLDTNLTAIEYHNYEVWLGVYPNDQPTIDRVIAVKARFPRIQHVVCPNDGPTTKADCLNALYDGLVEHEAASGRRHEIILQHDAEDMIHPRALPAMAEYCRHFDMVQAPVFPLSTPLYRFTHGVYCDEFAEYHWKELAVRARLGGFVPSAGVGTAYRRDALDKLRAANGGRMFETNSLTEDYVMGLDLHRLECSQALLHAWTEAQGEPQGREQIHRGQRELVATRAYFPFRISAAIRQRSRWIIGNALQSWARSGWQAGPGQVYWLWRDRKGLIGAPTAALANLLFLYGIARLMMLDDWLSIDPSGRSNLEAWLAANPILAAILLANLALAVWRQSVRGMCAFQVYGWAHALSVPLRAPWGNLINFCATARALWTFAKARSLRRPLRWAKTVHAYPGRESAHGAGRPLGGILVSMQVVSQQDIEEAMAGRAAEERLGEALLRLQAITEEQLHQALALQAAVPFTHLTSAAVDEVAWRYLQPSVTGGEEAIPFAVKSGQAVWIAVPRPPSASLRKRLSRSCRLPVQFALLSPRNFAELRSWVERRPMLVDHAPASRPRRYRLRTPQLELRIPLPGWLLSLGRLSLTLEYRRAR